MTSTAGSPTPSAEQQAGHTGRGRHARDAGPDRSRARAAAGGRRTSTGSSSSSRRRGREARRRAGRRRDVADIVVVLGGDGTVLRALTRFLGTGVPVIGVNFGRVGFLSSMGRRDLEAGLGARLRG